MKYLNYRNFQLLSNELENTADFELIEDAVSAFAGYVKDVVVGEQQIKTAYATLDGDELRERVTAIDQRRRNCHEKAIAQASMLNKLAALYGYQTIYTGETGNGDAVHNLEVRESVAEFCKEITDTLFDNRK